MSYLLGRHTQRCLPWAVGGEGCYLIDDQGKRYLDGSGGAAVSCLGHSDKKIKAAIRDQLDALAFAHTGFFTTQTAETLGRRLIEGAPSGLTRAYLVSGGSEAVEAAIKIACQYFVEIGQPQRTHIIGRRQSYHGNTLGALSAGGNMWRRKIFANLLIETRHIAPCYEYRDKRPNEDSLAYGQRVANELEACIQELGEDKVMAFIAEPVVGATAGAVPPVAGYLSRIREICDKHGVLLIFDEVMCGMGRTGSLYACEQDEVAPDILTIAKGLGAGYQPIGAMLMSSAIYTAIKQGSGFFQHGHTYMGHPMAAAAGCAVMERLLDDGVLNHVSDRGDSLRLALLDRFADHPHVGDIRGRGLFLGMEFVQDRADKQPFPPEKQLAGRIKQACFDAGLICYPMSGTIDGKQGDHLLLAPPFIIEETQIGELVDKLAKGLAQVF